MDATMKTLLLALGLAASACGVASANESRHSAIVDIPKVINLNHASPDTWDTLPPVQPNAELAQHTHLMTSRSCIDKI